MAVWVGRAARSVAITRMRGTDGSAPPWRPGLGQQKLRSILSGGRVGKHRGRLANKACDGRDGTASVPARATHARNPIHGLPRGPGGHHAADPNTHPANTHASGRVTHPRDLVGLPRGPGGHHAACHGQLLLLLEQLPPAGAALGGNEHNGRGQGQFVSTRVQPVRSQGRLAVWPAHRAMRPYGSCQQQAGRLGAGRGRGMQGAGGGENGVEANQRTPPHPRPHAPATPATPPTPTSHTRPVSATCAAALCSR